MKQEIGDHRKWRLSRSGCSIKTGWGDEKKIVASYPGALTHPIDGARFQEWMRNAETICKLYNNTLPPNAEQA